jgi:NDP-sugar pyrophosphorylase family protein
MNLHPVVILAGGLATRLRPLTQAVPKALVKVGGQPFIAQQLRLLRSHGVQQVIISTWYKAEMLREFLGDGRRFGVELQYAFDGDTPLGTGGAIRRILGLLHGPFFVLYGDSYLPCSYQKIQAFFNRQDRLGLMTVYQNDGRLDASNVHMLDGSILQYDKDHCSPEMRHIDYGLGLFRPAAFGHLQEGAPADLAQIYQALLRDGQLLAYEVPQRFYEIGSPEGLRELDRLLTSDPDQFLGKELT